jgi:hypothetical protein
MELLKDTLVMLYLTGNAGLDVATTLFVPSIEYTILPPIDQMALLKTKQFTPPNKLFVDWLQFVPS